MQKNKIIRILPKHASKFTFQLPINFGFIIGFISGVLISAIGFFIIFKWYSIQPENSPESRSVATKTLDNVLASVPSDDHLDGASQNPLIKPPATELSRSSVDTSRQTKVTETQDPLTKSHNPFTQLSTAARSSPPSPQAVQGRAQANNPDLKNNHNLKNNPDLKNNSDSKNTTKAAVTKPQVETKPTTKPEIKTKVEASAPMASTKPTQPSTSDMERSNTDTQHQIQPEERSTTIQISQPLTNQ